MASSNVILDKVFEVNTDACDVTDGVFPIQKGRQIAYSSEKLSDAKKYSIYDKEFYAIIRIEEVATVLVAK